MSEGIQWIVGNGQSIKIREDRWLPRGVLGGPANQGEPRHVADLITTEDRTWNVQLMTDLFDEDLTNEIRAIPLCINPDEDKLIWMRTSSGTYTVKSAYNMLYSQHLQQQPALPSTSYSLPRSFWTRLWQLNIFPKVRIFLWSACQNALPTRDNLYRKEIVPDPICPLCHRAPETVEHLLLLCPWTAPIWADPKLQGRTRNQLITRFDKWLSEELEATTNLLSIEEIAGVLWLIWKARNARVFQARRPNATRIIEEATTAHASFLRWNPAKPLNKEASYLSPSIWRPPEQGSLKLNVDGSTSEGSPLSAVAGVVRDSRGVLIHGFALEVHASSVMAAETLAVLYALKLLEEDADRRLPRAQQIDLETDCLAVVNCLQNSRESPWVVRAWADECKNLLGRLPFVRLAHCPREANNLTDWVAKARRQNTLPSAWLSTPPKPMLDILCSDVQILGSS